MKTLGIKRSNFYKLETLDFKDIIEEVTPIPGKKALIHHGPQEAPATVKQFDPFHLHVNIDGNDNEARKREPDTQYKCLYNVLYFIKSHAYVKAYTEK